MTEIATTRNVPVREGFERADAGETGHGSPESGQRPLRVLLVQTQAEAAGAQEISRMLGAGFEARGLDVHHAFLYRKTGSFDLLKNVFFASRQRPRSPIGAMRMIGALYAHIRRIKPDAVLCFQHYGNAIAGPLARLAGVPVVIANRNTSSAQMPAWLRSLDLWLGTLGTFSTIVVNSGATENECFEFPASYRRRLMRIDHGFDRKTSHLEKPEARRRFGLPAGPLIGCVARLHIDKNLAAAVRLLPGHPGWSLAFAGQGPERQNLEELAASLGCRDRVHFVGEIEPSRVGDFLRALDVFVFPTLIETFGLAAVEAAAAGVPVVAHDLPVLREVLTIGGSDACAVFVDTRDGRAFAEAVGKSFATEGDGRARAAQSKWLTQKYSVDRMVERYLALLSDDRDGA